MPGLELLAEGLPTRRGPIGLLSGDEFTPHAIAFDRALLAATPGSRVGLVTCADHANRAITARHAREHLATLDAELIDADVIHGDHHPDLDLIYLAGGSPKELLECLADNPLWRRVREAWMNGAALAGASAGAMALCAHSLTPREGDRVPTAWARGLGPIATVALAVHASSRPTTWLEEVKSTAPVALLALDDYTGVIIEPNGRVTKHGPGHATFV